MSERRIAAFTLVELLVVVAVVVVLAALLLSAVSGVRGYARGCACQVIQRQEALSAVADVDSGRWWDSSPGPVAGVLCPAEPREGAVESYVFCPGVWMTQAGAVVSASSFGRAWWTGVVLGGRSITVDEKVVGRGHCFASYADGAVLGRWRDVDVTDWR